MDRLRRMCVAGSLLIATSAGMSTARAELYKDVARGLALLDYQFSGQRNVLGDGITVNTAASYSNRTFDFGLAQLTLNGSVAASAGFTRRGIPGANFSLNAGSAANPIGYNFTINDGFEDVTAAGTAIVTVKSNVNLLGFYDQNIQISNRGTYTMDGITKDNATLDFDLGPVNKSGNLYVDLLAKATQPLFDAAGTDNFFSKLSNNATKVVDATKSLANLQARAAAGETLTEAELSQLINNTIITAVLGGKNSGSLFPSASSSMPLIGPVVVPEPSIITPLTMVFASGLLRRRRKV